MQFGTLEVLNDTPKLLNGILQLPNGTQPLSPTLMQFHAVSRSHVIFFRSFDTQKVFFIIKLRHSDKSNTHLFSKNHHLHHCSQKVINSSFLKTHGFMFQTRGIHPCFMHFQKKKKEREKKKIIIKISKNHASFCILGAFAPGSFFQKKKKHTSHASSGL